MKQIRRLESLVKIWSIYPNYVVYFDEHRCIFDNFDSISFDVDKFKIHLTSLIDDIFIHQQC